MRKFRMLSAILGRGEIGGQRWKNWLKRYCHMSDCGIAVVFTAFAVIVSAVGFSAPARAEVIVTIGQVGSDVVATGSGTLDVAGLPTGTVSTFSQLVLPSRAFIGLGTEQAIDQYVLASGPSDFGTGFVTAASGEAGDTFWVNGLDTAFGVATNYVSGSEITDFAIFTSETIASLGLTPGTYTFIFDTAHSTTDDIKVDILAPTSGPTSVPEPLTLSLFAAGLAGAVAMRRRKAMSA
jgi:hypothetical protein